MGLPQSAVSLIGKEENNLEEILVSESKYGKEG